MTIMDAGAVGGLRAALGDVPAPPPLAGAAYARAHAVYEAASDQRAAIRRLLARDVPPLVADVPAERPLRVLGVGVGDGSVDAALAAALAGRDGGVEYVGVEPHPPSAAAFTDRLAALRAPGLAVDVVVGPFDRAVRLDPVDLVHFVHSLYYVPDLDEAVDTALSLLRPGGALVALTAPLEPLCALGRALRPSAPGQWLAEDVRAALRARGLPLRVSTLTSRLDVRSVRRDPHGTGEQVLDFLVQARTAQLPARARAVLLDHLDAIALPGEPGTVPHPLEVVVARRP